ncbi:MAG: ABC transporter substrate-binding protein [Mucispirillum sp.]|uniref:ABC transporter substrate-binding protein n=1 Tax=Candidatus Mucispirillum faecigallinarum TaxID=2838699 RepID=A0A9D2KCG1_9BACT|nr:ABC transporter substrate-binding protein [Mucispirillum sp.]HIZ89003.1 ABC transporter substrate-binding protein [Candidatus Mucispirillum faecigallinarum]
MSLKKIVFITALSAITVLSLSGCKKAGENTADANIFIIGGQNPETGAMADYGSKTVLGAQIAFEEINAAGGINGKQIKFAHYDSRGEKTDAVNLTRRLLKENACAIIGEITSGGFLAMRELANDGGTVAISTGATAEHVTEKRVGDGYEHIPFAFRNTLQDSDGAPSLTKYLMHNKGFKKFALITSTNNEYSVGLSNFFRDAVKNAGGTIVIEQSINDGDADVSAQITSIKNSGADAIIFTGYYQEAARLLLTKKAQGVQAPLVGGDGFQSPDLWNIAGDAAIGAMFYSGFSAEVDRPKIQSFKAKMLEKGKEADTFSAQGYDAAYLLAEAMKAANVTDCSNASQRDAIRAKLMEIKDFDGITGKMSIDATGSAIKEPFLLEVIKKSDGTYGTQSLN